MLNSLVQKYNDYRKKQLLQAMLPAITKKYAFIGAGIHSISTLFPLLKQFNVPLRYIVTRQSANSKALQQLFPGVQCIHSIETVVNDPEVAGVFISVGASQHVAMLSTLLPSGKAIFVEKPPCTNSEELRRLISLSRNSICKVGLQRRYWPANARIRTLLKSVSSYTYRFHTGTFLDGDTLTGLFIHPFDYIHFLFGHFELLSFTNKKASAGNIIQAHIQHSDGISGLLELSTNGSWNAPIDELVVDTAAQSLRIQYPVSVTALQKPSRILNIPTERVLHKPQVSKTYFGISNLVVPAAELNTLVLQGFYDEVKSFLAMTEANSGQPANDLPGLENIYAVMDKIRSQADQ